MTRHPRSGNPLTGGILMATAFLLAALVVVQAGRAPRPSAFAGDAVVGSEGFTMLTASSGFGKDVRPYELLYVLDNYSEMMFVYEVPQSTNRSVSLLGGMDLPYLFRMARGAGN